MLNHKVQSKAETAAYKAGTIVARRGGHVSECPNYPKPEESAAFRKGWHDHLDMSDRFAEPAKLTRNG